MKFLLLVSLGLLAIVQAAFVKRLDESEEICIESIVPCPERCPDTCIYPELPCPKQYTPRCPGEEPPLLDENLNCSNYTCPPVEFEPCPEDCYNGCELTAPKVSCCPLSGELVCKDGGVM